MHRSAVLWPHDAEHRMARGAGVSMRCRDPEYRPQDGAGSAVLFYHSDWPAVLDAVLGFLCEPVSPGPRLAGRELEVAELVAAGLTNQAIARRLSVAPRTAEAHVENIRRKLEARSRAQIAAWVTEHRLRP